MELYLTYDLARRFFSGFEGCSLEECKCLKGRAETALQRGS